MPLKDFISERALNTNQNIDMGGGGSLQNFMKNKGIVSSPEPEKKKNLLIMPELPKEKSVLSIPTPEPEPEKKKSVFSWIGKQLSKGSGFAAKEQRAVGESLGNLFSIASGRVDAGEGIKAAANSFVKHQKGAWNVLKGDEETNMRRELEDAGIELSAVDKAMALSNDIMIDPLNVLPVGKILGLGKRAVGTVGKVTKLDKPISALGKLDSVKSLKGLFSNATANKEFNNVVGKFRNLSTYREGALMDDAVNLEKSIRKFSKSGIKNADEIIVEGLENVASRATIKDKKVLNTIETLEKTYADFLAKSREVGLSVGEIAEYAPRIRTKESFLKEVAGRFGIGSKEFSIGGIEKGREILKLVPEEGKEVIGNWRKMGLKKIDQQSFSKRAQEVVGNRIGKMQNNISKFETKIKNLKTKRTLKLESKKGLIEGVISKNIGKKTGILQTRLDKILKDEIEEATKDLSEIITNLKTAIVSEGGEKIAKEAAEKVGKEEFDDIIQSIIKPKRDEMELLIKELEKEVMDSSGKEFLKKPLVSVPKLTKEQLASKTQKQIKSVQNQFTDLVNKSEKEINKRIGDVRLKLAERLTKKQSEITSKMISLQNEVTDKISKMEQFDFIGKKGKLFKRGEATMKELSNVGIDIFEKNPAIQLAKKGQAYVKAITSKEFANEVAKFATEDGVDVTNSLLKGKKFEPDVARVIDNFYEGIKPKELKLIVSSFDKIQNIWKAQALVSPSYSTRNIAGNLWNNYLADVNPWAYEQATRLQTGMIKNADLMDEMKQLGVIDQGWYAKDIGEEIVDRVAGIKNWKKGLNPLGQQNYILKANKAVGTAVENNARMAHYLSKKAGGMSPEDAARSVKKYLFDYGDITSFEKSVMKRTFPFYVWSRKNLPLQLEGLITKPAKFSLPHKLISAIESGVEKPNEKYMGHYIRENVPVRTKVNEEGDTEYFLLGSWLPYSSAIDMLSNPIENLVGMTSPIAKTPYEQGANLSTFFKNTLGEQAPIERTFKQQGEFLGSSMRKKNIQLLRNIRVLNDIDKWIDKKDPTAVQNSYQVKLLNTLFGKAATYDVGKSKFFYDSDTDDRIAEYKKAIKSARKKNYDEKAEELTDELNEFKRVRYGEY